MLQVGNKFILNPIEEILEVLRIQLHQAGIDKLNSIKVSGNNIQISCPIHKEGKERKPSCGISIVENPKTPMGTVHCFTCSYRANFQEFVSNCFNYNDHGRFGSNWLIQNFIVGVNTQRTINRVGNRKEIKLNTYIEEEELDSYRYIHSYMYKRKLTDEIIEKFDVGYDKETKCLTFPVWDKEGNCLFIARRSVNTKYFKYPEKVKKPLYGRHFITDTIKTIIICESIINTLTCWVYGKPSIALIGLGNKQQISELRRLNVRKYILALDPDEEGQNAAMRIRKYLKDSGKIISEFKLPLGCDINDLSKEEFLNLEEVY